MMQIISNNILNCIFALQIQHTGIRLDYCHCCCSVKHNYLIGETQYCKCTTGEGIEKLKKEPTGLIAKGYSLDHGENTG